MSRYLRSTAFVGVLALAAAGCGGGKAGGTAEEMPTIRIAQSVEALSFAPLYIARERGFFEQQGVNVDFQLLQSGATAQQALLGGSVDAVASASTEMAAAVGGGADFVAAQGIVKMTQQLCVSMDLLQQRGVSPDSPLPERMAALEGATIGISGPGAASDRVARWLLSEYGGLDPNRDVTITTIGGPSAQANALKQNNIQAFVFSPPTCALTGDAGEVLVEPTDVSELQNYIHEVLYATRDWAQENKNTLTRAATALSMGNRFMLQNPDESIAILEEYFPEVDPQTVEESVKGTILPQVPEDGRMSEDMWKTTTTVLLEAGMIEEPLDVSEGGFWTNEYIGDLGS